MKRDESIDVQIGISAGWKVVKGFCDESKIKKKEIKIKIKKKRKNTYRKYLQFNRPGWRLGLGLGLGFLRMTGGYVIWWASASVSAVSAHAETWIYMRMLKMYLKIAHTHRCTAVIHVTRWQHSCAPSRGTGRGTRAWPMPNPNWNIQPDWCPRNLHWSSLNTEFGIGNME